MTNLTEGSGIEESSDEVMTEIEQLKREIAWRTRAMERYEAYIAKVLKQIETLESHVGMKLVVEWELRDSASETETI